VLAVSLAAGWLAPHAAAAGQPPPTRDGRALYQAACASCHGADGRGASQAVVGFDTPLPDFADCNFATREPDPDWLAIVQHGGPARAFDRLMPAFGQALSHEELQRVLAHVRGFCPERDWPRGELNLPRALVTEKAYPEDEAVITADAAAEGPGALTTTLLYERRFGARNQVEIVVPVPAHAAGAEGWQGGIGDIAAGVKRALFHRLDRGTIFSAGGEIVLPTGDRERDLGKGAFIVEPFLAFGQLLPADGFVQAHAGLELSTNRGRAPHEAFWRAALGRTFAQDGGAGRAWSPMVELLGARELVAGAPPEWDLLPQVQVTLSRRQHVMASVGVRVPLNGEGRETRVLAYLLWDWFDGGLFVGW
jgi:mono/diheme cytochrome c family protein